MSQTTVLLLTIFSAIGLIDTIYLSYHAFFKTDVACWFFPVEWCRRVQYSKYSKTFGIPNPYLGLLMYASILSLLYIFPSPAWLVKVIVVFGFAFSMYFTFIQAFVLRAFCTWCVVSAINFSVMFVAILI